MDSGTTFKMFGCPVCGYRVSQEDEACPRCGNGFSGTTRFECPFCGELVDPNMKKCPSCQVDYSDFKSRTEARGGDDAIDDLLEEIIKIESQQAKTDDKTKKLSCPECAWLLTGSETKCPKCGADLRDDMSFQCPICGSMVGASSSSCPECGASFEGEEGQEAQKETEPEPPPPPELGFHIAASQEEPEPSPPPAPEPVPEPEPEPASPPVIFVKPSRKKTAPAQEPTATASEEAPPQPAPEIFDPTEGLEEEPAPHRQAATAPKKKTRKLKVKTGSKPKA